MSKFWQRRLLIGTIILVSSLGAALSTPAQGTVDQDDPVKLFERGQDAHSKSDFKTAIEFYDAAIRLKPEFPEAEFQRALALLFSNRKDEALQGFNRTVELRPDWAFAYARFGSQLSGYFNDAKINLIPPFQRGHVWTLPTRQKLVQNIVNNRPIPAIFLYKEAVGSKYTYNILDGKQRLESLLLFIGSKRPGLGITGVNTPAAPQGH